MIFYFSATGNSKHVAEQIAEAGEELVSIAEATDDGRLGFEVTDGRVGIISPTYNWTLPSIVSEFLENFTLYYEKRPYLYYVGTYGTTTGAAAEMAGAILARKNLHFNGIFDIKMPDTWTPTFNLSDKEHVAKINENAEREIAILRRQVANKMDGKDMGLTMPLFLGKLGLKIYNEKTRNTANLSVTDDCVGCGLCAKKCPAHAIEMRDKRPVWVKEQCVMCLGCLHRCPKFAIQCGKNTVKHGQYMNPHTRV